MDLELHGRTALITGGSRGIGKAVALALAREGVDLAIVARTRAALEAAANELEKETGRRILPVVADAGNGEQVQSAVDEIKAAFGHIDILVNNANVPRGQAPTPPWDQMTDDEFYHELDPKLAGYMRFARAVVPGMKQRGWGRIINVSGLSARRPTGITATLRCVGVVAMSGNLAAELGRHGIAVTTVHPGSVLTEWSREAAEAAAAREGISYEEAERARFKANASARIVEPKDVAAVVTFLASPLAWALNGDVLSASGGDASLIRY